MEITMNEFGDLKFDGRPSYTASDEQVLKAYEDEKDPLVKSWLAALVASRFKKYVPKSDESKDECQGRIIEDLVNGRITNFEKTADRMARSHRYLQNEMFKLFRCFVKKLADNYDKGWYDPRNEWACKTAKDIVDII